MVWPVDRMEDLPTKKKKKSKKKVLLNSELDLVST